MVKNMQKKQIFSKPEKLKIYRPKELKKLNILIAEQTYFMKN